MTISDIEVFVGLMAPMLSLVGFAFVSGYLNPRSHQNQYSFKTISVVLLWLIGPVMTALGGMMIPILWYGVIQDDDGVGVKAAGRFWPYVPGLVMGFVSFYLVHLYVRALNAYGQLMDLERKS